MDIDKLKTSIIVFLSLVLVVFLIRFGSVPEEYVAYPDKTDACARFYNYSSDGAAVVTSEVIFTLKSDIGPCDISGRIEISTSGAINVCTPNGWVTHQPDE